MEKLGLGEKISMKMNLSNDDLFRIDCLHRRTTSTGADLVRVPVVAKIKQKQPEKDSFQFKTFKGGFN